MQPVIITGLNDMDIKNKKKACRETVFALTHLTINELQ